MSNSRRKYTKDFKLKVVKEHLEGASLTELSKMYGIAPSTIGTWLATLKDEVEVEEEEVLTVVDPDIVAQLEELKAKNLELEKRLEEKNKDIQELTKLLNKGVNLEDVTEKDRVIEELEDQVKELHSKISVIREEATREFNILKEAFRILTKD